MEKTFYRTLLLIGTVFAGFLAFASLHPQAATWHQYSPKIMGYAKKQRIIKYNGSNWGNYEEIYLKKYFKDTQSTKYQYNHKSRKMIIRYVNPSKSLGVNTKYNYRKLVFHGSKSQPVIQYYYKLGNQKFQFLYTIKYWMFHPIKY
ncbi:hypothetical protein [Lentilactobacillus otakiensis]|uniref:hypothetical protein n=1 Tax=Lentilactobacillus otakiensis TaxID=481720 RepID=UPI003D16D941